MKTFVTFTLFTLLQYNWFYSAYEVVFWQKHDKTSGDVVFIVGCLLWQGECLFETQANVYERFLSGMMAKDKKQEEKSEEPDEDQEDNPGTSVYVSDSVESYHWQKVCFLWKVGQLLGTNFIS